MVRVRTAEPHDELHLACDLVFAEVVSAEGEGEDVDSSANQRQNLASKQGVDVGQLVEPITCF